MDVGGDLLVAQEADDPEPFAGHRQADDDRLAELGQLPGLLVHRLRLARGDRGEDRAVADLGELGDDLPVVASRGQDGFGADDGAVQQPPFLHAAGFVGVEGVEEEPHS